MAELVQNPNINKPGCQTLNADIPLGFLTDAHIRRALGSELLLQNADPSHAKYATYELSIGTPVKQLVPPERGTVTKDLYRERLVGDDNLITIMPGETFVLHSRELVNMPANVLAFAIPVGNMYRLGLNPETTFIDPGYAGKFYMTVCNYSSSIVTLKVGEPLSRLFFCKLNERPERIHDGPPRDVAPSVQKVPLPTAAELKDEMRVISDVVQLVDPPHYQHAIITRSFFHMRRRLSAVSLVCMFTSALVLLTLSGRAYGFAVARWPSGTERAVAGAVTALGMFLLGVLWKPLREAIVVAVRDVVSAENK